MSSGSPYIVHRKSSSSSVASRKLQVVPLIVSLGFGFLRKLLCGTGIPHIASAWLTCTQHGVASGGNPFITMSTYWYFEGSFGVRVGYWFDNMPIDAGMTATIASYGVITVMAQGVGGGWNPVPGSGTHSHFAP